MVKLQQTKRHNGSIVSSVNLPRDLVEKLGWEKGTGLEIRAEQLSTDSNPIMIISKKERQDG